MPRHVAALLLLILLGCGLGAALLACVARVSAERSNRSVAIVVDYGQARALASVAGLTVGEVLAQLKQAGATHAAVTEQTVHQVLAGGEVAAATIRPQDRVTTMPPTTALIGPPDTVARLRRSLTRRLGLGLRVASMVPETTGTCRLHVAGPALEDFEDLGIGYPTGAVQEVRRAGLALVVRPHAEGNQWQAALSAALDEAQSLGAELIVSAGVQAPGFPGNTAAVADEFRKRDLRFGYVEFGKQYGDLALAARLPESLVRVHSINETEMLTMSPGRAVDRLALAVRERNVRACYVRLFEPAGSEPLRAATGYLSALTSRLRAHGLVPAPPQPFPGLSVAPWLRWMTLLGALAACGLCLLELLGVSPARTLILVGAAAAVSVAGMAAAPDLMPKLGALLAALALPTLAVGRIRPGTQALARGSAAFTGLVQFAATSGISLAGGVLIAGALADTRFLLKLDQFSGVKLAHLLPLVAVFLLQVGWDLGRPRDGDAPWAVLVRGWVEAAQSVVRYWHVAALLLGLAGLALLVLRSGNEGGLGVSSAELQFRSLLDRIFGVRPRTKEVLIGHPLLILGLMRAALGKRAGAWVLLALGVVGQVSLVNTFSHLHTPVLISLARTLHGLWFGAVIGLSLFLVVEGLEAAWGRARGKLPGDPSAAP